MKKIILAVALMVAVSAFAQTEKSKFKTETIEFIKLTGSGAMFDSAIDQVGANVPAENKDAYKAEALKSLDGLYSKMADMYMEEFTETEISELVKFYKSDLGKKVASKQSQMAQKGMVLGQNWGMGLGKIAQKFSQKDGVDFNSPQN
jgi:hypothetical protein